MKKEFNILSYFNFRALFMGIGLSKILISTNRYFIVSIILGTILGIIFLLLNDSKNKNKFINTLSNYIVFIIAFVILINMISTMYLTEMSILFLTIPIILLLLYLLTKEEKIIYRIGNVLLIINLGLYVLSFFSLIKYIDLSSFNYIPYNIKNILLSSLEYATLSTTPIILSKNTDIKNKHIVKTYIISSITLSAIFFLTYSILGYKLVTLYRYPEYIILKKVSITSAIQNIENIFSFLWIIDVFMLMASSVNKIKANLNNNILVYFIIFFSFIPIMYISKHYNLLISTYKYTPYVFLILYLLSFIKTKKNVNK